MTKAINCDHKDMDGESYPLGDICALCGTTVECGHVSIDGVECESGQSCPDCGALIAESFQTEFIVKQKEVTEARYDEMLGCLPPRRMLSNAFLVGEPVDFFKGEERYELYFIEDGKYYHGGLATVKDFELFTIERALA